MLKYTMQVQNAATKPRKNEEKKKSSSTKLTKEKLPTKRGNKPQAPLASEQKSQAQVVW